MFIGAPVFQERQVIVMFVRSAIFSIAACLAASSGAASAKSCVAGDVLDPGGLFHKRGSCKPSIQPPRLAPPLPQAVSGSLPLPAQLQHFYDQLDKTQKDAEHTIAGQTDEIVVIVTKVGGDSLHSLIKANETVVISTYKAASDTTNTVVKAGNDVKVAYVKGWKDTTAQTKSSFEDVIDAGKAVATFTQEQTEAHYKEIGSAYRRARQGKVIDALWGSAVEPAQATDKNAFEAVQKSVVLNAVAEAAATTYGGPAGAAAYAAWYTYKTTGDATLALKAGALSVISSYAGGSIAHMPTGTMGAVLKKAAVTGAVAGIAAAAAGGDENAVKDAVLKSGGAVLVQGVTAQVNAYSPQAHDALQAVQCISARDVDCLSHTTYARDAAGKLLYDSNGQPRVDPTKLDPKQFIGQWTGIDPKSFEGQKNAILTEVSKVPDTQSIAIDHNRWVVTWTLGKSPTLAYSQPSVVLTYVGSRPPFYLNKTYRKAVVGSITAPAPHPPGSAH